MHFGMSSGISSRNRYKMGGHALRLWNYTSCFNFSIDTDAHRKRILQVQLSAISKAGDDSISAIRHAAVHRLAQDRQSLLRMTRAAIGFVQCMSGSSHTQSLRRLRKYLRVALPRPSRRSVVPRRQARFQSCRVENGLSHSSHPSITLPEPLQGILHLVENDFSHEVRQFLEKEFE